MLGLAELLGAIKVQQKTDVQAGHDGSDKPTIISTLSSREKAADAAAPLASARRGEADQKTNGLHLRPGNWFRNWFLSRSFILGLVLVSAGTGSVFLPGLLKRPVQPATKAAQITSPASPSPKRALNYFYGAWENTDAQTRGLRAVGNQDGWSKDIGHRLGKMPSNRLRRARSQPTLTARGFPRRLARMCEQYWRYTRQSSATTP